MKSLSDYEYYRTNLGVLYCGDCLEILPLIPDNSVDLVLTDPPYGINADKMQMGKGTKHKWDKKYKWDNKIPKQEIFEWIKLCKNYLVWGGNYFIKYFEPTDNWEVWDKKNDGRSFSEAEMALRKSEGKIRFIRLHSNQGEKFHPTQKPIELFKQCLIKYSNQGSLIVDPFLGSGTTGIVCELSNRRWIGIEISEKYCEIAKKRISEEANQLKLFK